MIMAVIAIHKMKLYCEACYQPDCSLILLFFIVRDVVIDYCFLLYLFFAICCLRNLFILMIYNFKRYLLVACLIIHFQSCSVFNRIGCYVYFFQNVFLLL